MTDQERVKISAALRALAREARRLLAWGGSAAEVAALSGRIGAIQDRWRGPTSTPLMRWLDSLQHRVTHLSVETRGRTPRSAGATRGAPSCR